MSDAERPREYWSGFAAALDTIEFGTRFGAHWRLALRRARLFAQTKIAYLDYGWCYAPGAPATTETRPLSPMITDEE